MHLVDGGGAGRYDGVAILKTREDIDGDGLVVSVNQAVSGREQQASAHTESRAAERTLVLKGGVQIRDGIPREERSVTCLALVMAGVGHIPCGRAPGEGRRFGRTTSGRFLEMGRTGGG